MYKRKGWKRKGRTNKHHIKNKVKNGKDGRYNTLVLDEERHAAFHFLFGNLDFYEVIELLERTLKLKNKTRPPGW